MDRRLLCVVFGLLCLLAESHAYSAKQVYRNLNKTGNVNDTHTQSQCSIFNRIITFRFTEQKYFLQYFLAKGYVEQRNANTMSVDLKFPTDLNIPKATLKKFEVSIFLSYSERVFFYRGMN